MCAKNAFFDPSRARGPRRGPDVGAAPDADAGDPARAWTVSALLGRVKDALGRAFPRHVSVVGELSNVKRHTSGHLYFRLKDARTAVDAVMFRGRANKVKFTPADGLNVIAEGRVDVYEVRGQLQLYVERLTPKGTGALELAFRQLRDALQREGLFADEAKKPIPTCPRAIGVVTSASGAAIRDIRRTLRRRWRGATVYLVGVRVQGDRAPGEIAEAVRRLDAAAERLGVDTILVARGGGSLEDLWAFNEEVVARAIFAARTPIISGVGHESDVTICDLVADARAATPTAAAQRAVPDADELSRRVTALGDRLMRSLRQRVARGRTQLAGLERSAALRDPLWRVRSEAQHIDEVSRRLTAAARQHVSRQRQRLAPAEHALAALHPARLAEQARARLREALQRLRWALGGRTKRGGDRLAALAARLAEHHPRHRLRLARQQLRAAERQLEAISYRRVLERGFTVTRDGEGRILRSAGASRDGQRIETQFHDGRVASRVERAAPGAGSAQRRRGTRRNTDEPTLFNDTEEGSA
ncbi:MAG: exodeoxyribonuclease VII large subunit [Phycisphaerae bacterium]|nr:exodeoxyribonuclease VII large subunit [Phycisphaerae bacterium]